MNNTYYIIVALVVLFLQLQLVRLALRLVAMREGVVDLIRTVFQGVF